MILDKKTKLLQKTTVVALLACLVQAALPLAYADTLRTGIGTNAIVDLYSNNQTNNTNMLKLNDTAKITNSATRISVALRDSDVRQVLRMFADKANMNIIFHESVKGKVTLDLVNTTLNDAFMLVLDTSGLTFFQDTNNTLVVAGKNDAQKLSLGRKNLTVLPVKYADSVAVADFLNSNVFGSKITGLSNEKIATANPGANEVIIFGSKNDVDAAKNVLVKLDKKPMVNTFKVNHTTPKEMANLICKAVIPGAQMESEGDAAGGAGARRSMGQGQILGAAAASGGEGEGGSALAEVTLGGATLACKARMEIEKKASSSGGGSRSNQNQDDGDPVEIAPFASTPISVAYYPQLGTVGVFGGSVQQLEVIREFIDKNDRKQLMAYLEMSVVELNEDGSKDFSNNWNLATPFGALGFNSTGVAIGSVANPIKLFTDAGGAKWFADNGTTGNTTANYALNYIVKNGNGRLLTNPKIIITNGQKSVIDMTADYIKTIKTEYQSGTLTSEPITNKTVEVASDDGLKIEIMPFISLDGYVTLNVMPNYATVKEQIMDGDKPGDILATLLQRRNLQLNNLRIKDGETLVIAGMIRESETQTVSKVPVLGDLPLLGVMFRNTLNKKEKMELVIMLTPHIVYDDEQLVNAKKERL